MIAKMLREFNRGKIERRLEKKRIKLAGKEAALRHLGEFRKGNYLIAEDIGELREEISQLEGKLK